MDMAVLIEPIKTEKAIGKIEFDNCITFRVDENATKKEPIMAPARAPRSRETSAAETIAMPTKKWTTGSRAKAPAIAATT